MTGTRGSEPEDGPARELIEGGSAVVGTFTGGALSLVAGPLVGGPVGVVVSRVVRRIGIEVRARQIGPRQEERIGGVLLVAAAEINRRLEAGELPREDGFFVEETGRSPGDELLEGVVLAAADAYEELKVPFIGRLYASLTFRPDITAEHGNALLRLVERLSYRQLACLAFFIARAGDLELSHFDADRELRGFPPIPAGLGLELNELGDLGLLGVESTGGAVVPAGATYGGAKLEGVQFGNVQPLPTGSLLAELLGLAELDTSAHQTVVETLQASVA